MRRPSDSISADAAPAEAARRSAVVEILPDGTLAAPLIAATDAVEAAGRLRRSGPASIPADLDANLGELQAAHGHLHEAAQTLTQGMRGGRAAADPDRCAGQLALVEAFQGELRQAQAHADLALLTVSIVVSTAPRRASSTPAWARAGVHL
ncbi:hypothetical protein [Aeromicrobium sp. UC242_57]|uniref:hypothetical protein n=1 Tax=Aeromicrobium sp. UC242_57 TaxID=3374624 RepID=UPI00379BBA05